MREKKSVGEPSFVEIQKQKGCRFFEDSQKQFCDHKLPHLAYDSSETKIRTVVV